MMRIAAIAFTLCIGFLAWYSYPNPPPDADSKPPQPAPPSAPAETATSATGPERFVDLEDPCPIIDHSRDWDDMRALLPGLSDAELCEFITAPDYAKLASMEIDREVGQRILNRYLAEGDYDSDYLADVPDLRFYLDPQAIALVQGLSEDELIHKINNEHSAEAAYWLAMHYQEQQHEQTYVALMLNAASYARRPGPLYEAINGCCSYTLDDPVSKRAADIKREALVMIARELNLPDAEHWPEFEIDPDIAAEVLAQRAAYVEAMNHYSMQAFGEDWVK